MSGVILMEQAVIYLKQSGSESLEILLTSTKSYISKLKDEYIIKNVLFDSFNDTYQLDNFINSTSKKLDVFIIDHLINDEFNLTVLKEVSKMENFRIEYVPRNT